MAMGPVRVHHSSHVLGWQSSHSVYLAGWQVKMASIEIWIPWRNAHKPHSASTSGFLTSYSEMNWNEEAVKPEQSWPFWFVWVSLITLGLKPVTVVCLSSLCFDKLRLEKMLTLEQRWPQGSLGDCFYQPSTRDLLAHMSTKLDAMLDGMWESDGWSRFWFVSKILHSLRMQERVRSE